MPLSRSPPRRRRRCRGGPARTAGGTTSRCAAPPHPALDAERLIGLQQVLVAGQREQVVVERRVGFGVLARRRRSGRPRRRAASTRRATGSPPVAEPTAGPASARARRARGPGAPRRSRRTRGPPGVPRRSGSRPGPPTHSVGGTAGGATLTGATCRTRPARPMPCTTGDQRAVIGSEQRPGHPIPLPVK